MLQRLRLVDEVVGVRLRHDSPFVRLLDEVFIPLLLGECDSILFRLELDLRALHEVCA